MRSDDVTAAAAIALGAALSFALTARIFASDPAPVLPEPVPIIGPAPMPQVRIFIGPDNVSRVKLMVGPEGAHSKWAPPESDLTR